MPSGKAGFVLATVLETKGSTPRDRGAKMVVTEDTVFDTIGGGKLEQLVIDAAREALKLKVKTQQLEHFPLAGKAQQCCGVVLRCCLKRFQWLGWLSLFLVRVTLDGRSSRSWSSATAGCNGLIPEASGFQPGLPVM